MFLAISYIRPKYSQQHNEEIFSKLIQDIADLSCLGKIFLSGDFNCRTGDCLDFIENDSVLPKTDSVTLSDNCTLDTDFKGNNRDKIVNSQGKLSVEMCIESRLRNLNGRFFLVTPWVTLQFFML